MGALLNFEQTQVVESCCNCGIAFSMPQGFVRKRREDGVLWYCPNGHAQHYTETEVMRLQRELDRRTLEVEAQTRRATVAEERERRTTRKLRRVEKRVANGVCPCCNRSFVQLARHMKSKHPDYPGKAGEALATKEE